MLLCGGGPGPKNGGVDRPSDLSQSPPWHFWAQKWDLGARGNNYFREKSAMLAIFRRSWTLLEDFQSQLKRKLVKKLTLEGNLSVFALDFGHLLLFWNESSRNLKDI